MYTVSYGEADLKIIKIDTVFNTEQILIGKVTQNYTTIKCINKYKQKLQKNKLNNMYTVICVKIPNKFKSIQKRNCLGKCVHLCKKQQEYVYMHVHICWNSFIVIKEKQEAYRPHRSSNQ